MESIKEITFSNAPFDMLTVPEDKKKVIKSLAESRVRLGMKTLSMILLQEKDEGSSFSYSTFIHLLVTV